MSYNKLIVDNWDKYVGKKGREDRKNFLVKILRKRGHQKILDASLGTGGDSISLIKEGFEVVGNEIERALLAKAKRNALFEGIKLTTTSQDWRNLSKFPDLFFDTAFVLGNSLTHLFKKKDQLKVLKEFYRILRRGGALIVDERNYQYILDRRTKILKNPLKNLRLRHKRERGRATYAEEGVRMVPTLIEKNKIVLSCYSKTGQRLGSLEGYPFKHNELRTLLEQAGFSKIIQYSDLKLGFDPKADFYEYVAEK